jgi:hypothetical protein
VLRSPSGIPAAPAVPPAPAATAATAAAAPPGATYSAGVTHKSRILCGLPCFTTAADDFLGELDDWWTRFTSWVGILASEDFVGLGGYRRRGTRSGSLSMWTCNEHGQRAGRDIRSYFTPNQGIPISVLEIHDLEACVTAAWQPRSAPYGMAVHPGCAFASERRRLSTGGDRRARHLRTAIVGGAAEGCHPTAA